jgi:outer membrane protein, multidrug efflux system
LIAYKQAIQHAFGDVSDALITYQKFHGASSPGAGRKGLGEVGPPLIVRYQGGTTTYLEVLDGQRLFVFDYRLTI